MSDPTCGKDPPYSVADASFKECPVQTYETLRDDRPAYKDPLTGFYILTRYDGSGA
jgi:hypothetical protein